MSYVLNQRITLLFRGVAKRGVLGCPWPPLGRPSFEQTTYNIQVAKTPWQYLGHKSHCWKDHFFKICFFVKYFRQQLLSLVNMGLHAAIIWLSPLIQEGEQQYKPYIVGDPQMVSVLWPHPLKNPGYAPVISPTYTTFWSDYYRFPIRDRSLFMWGDGGGNSWGGPGLFCLEKRGGPKENFTMIEGGWLCVL